MIDRPQLRKGFKIILIALLVLITSFHLFKNEQQLKEASAIKVLHVIDGDTAIFNIDGIEEKVRFIAINCPEDTTKKEAFGQEATARTKELLETATLIEIEDEDEVIYDEYGRRVAWVWVDHKLIQETLIEEGLAKVAYIFDDYKYVNELKVKEHIAKIYHKGIWSNAN